MYTLQVILEILTKYEDEVIYADKNGGKSNRVTFAFLGDGIHEVMNLTGLFDSPVM
jgi:hypothetical protein